MNPNPSAPSQATQRSASGPASAPPRRSRLRKWLGRLAYLVFLLVIVEATLQIYYYATVGQPLWDRQGLPIYARHEHAAYPYWNKPNLSLRHNTNEFRIMVYTNRQGLRTSSAHEEYAPGRDPSRFRILLMGPSFAYGWGVNYEESVGAHLEHMLNDAGFVPGGRSVQVINAGVPSLGPAENLAWLEHVGKGFQPDLVVQFVYGSMAVPRDVSWNLDIDDKGYLIRRNQSFFVYAKDRAKNSTIVFYGWMAWARLSAAMRSDKGGEVTGAGRPMQVPTVFDPANSEVVEADAFYDQLRAAIEKANTKLLVVYFPLAYGVHPEDITRWLHRGVQNVDQERAYNQQFCEHVTARGVECLNITQQLVDEAKKGTRMYFWLDIHWTPEGNRTAARAISDYLLAAGPVRIGG